MNISRFVLPAALGFFCLSSTARNAHAAVITWGVATTISGDSDVLNTGTKVGAFNLGGGSVPSTTVNGVTFDAFARTGNSTSVGNFTLASTNGLGNNSTFGSNSAPFTNLSTNYQTLLQSAIIDTSSPMTLTMGGLTSGTNYSFQWWTNDSGGSVNVINVTGSSGNSVILDPNTTDVSGGLGQFVIGTFIADSASQVVTFSPPTNRRPILNAFQLRTNVVPTPEPSTYAMMALGLVALCVLGAKRKKDEQVF